MKIELQCGDCITIPKGCKAVIKYGCVVFEKEEEVQEFKDGDVLVLIVNGHRHNAFIYKNTDIRGFHSYYIGLNMDNHISIDNSDSKWGNQILSHATEEEKQLLFAKMKEQGLRWNAEKKRVEKIRWRSEDGEEYCYIGNQGFIMVDKEDGHCADKNRHEFGNYFRTEEQTKEAGKRVKETLRKYHEEIGE